MTCRACALQGESALSVVLQGGYQHTIKTMVALVKAHEWGTQLLGKTVRYLR